MFREDYVVRIIRQFVQLLARILGLKEMHQYPQALALIDQTFQELLGLNAATVYHLSERDLIAMVTEGDVVATGKLRVLAELLKLEGDVYAAQGNLAESYSRYLKSLNLLLEVARMAGATEWPQEFSKIEAVADLMRPVALPAETQTALFDHYEAAGRYARAEDVLFERIETGPVPARVIAEGIAFYERLSEKSDAELAAGNLPRAEVEESLAELHRHLKQPFDGRM